jgi:hypothetical protein
VEDVATGPRAAWFPILRDGNATHASGRSWAGGAGDRRYLSLPRKPVVSGLSYLSRRILIAEKGAC